MGGSGDRGFVGDYGDWRLGAVFCYGYGVERLELRWDGACAAAWAWFSVDPGVDSIDFRAGGAHWVALELSSAGDWACGGGGCHGVAPSESGDRRAWAEVGLMCLADREVIRLWRWRCGGLGCLRVGWGRDLRRCVRWDR